MLFHSTRIMKIQDRMTKKKYDLFLKTFYRLKTYYYEKTSYSYMGIYSNRYFIQHLYYKNIY